MDWIDYRQLPASAGGFSELFFDYLDDFSKVRQFFPSNFRDNAAYENVIRAVTGRMQNRDTLASVLTDQNRSFGSSAKALENIALLRRPTTLAVVTGQQVGLLGGPLYTVFKTLTTVKLAEQLKARFPSYDFVPVFWLEGEDHDFEEMNNCAVLDAETRVARIEYLPGGQPPERNLGAIGELVFDGTIEQSIGRLETLLQKSEFTQPVLSNARSCYHPGVTFNQAFASWMNVMFGDRGIVFISANHPSLKRLLSPLFIREITEFPKTSQIVITQSAELEKSYHAQTKAKSINLFMFHKGGRYLIEPRESDFSLKGTRHFLQRDELLKIAQESPELLSPNVILRPLAQDMLLPTAAYVAGPSEVAYHAQLKPVYEHLGVIQPVIYPRASGSFVEERLQRAMEKYGLSLLEFLGDVGKVTSKVVEQISEVKVDQIFDNAGKQVHDAVNELRFGLREIDPTLIGALENATSKIDITLGVLKEKSSAAQKKRNEVAVRQIERSAQALLPDGGLQERTLNLIYYMNKYGPDLAQWLSGQIDITGFRHQVFSL
jgi:bacillithiol biosynthesis cysteine-adding enzyme BshC